MEDLVAVEVRTTSGAVCYFLTWGRVQDAVEASPLEELILSVAHRFDVPGEPDSARVCGSLREASGAPLFYEALFDFAQRPIPFGDGYDSWREATARKMRAGQEIYFVGPWTRAGDAEPPIG